MFLGHKFARGEGDGRGTKCCSRKRSLTEKQDMKAKLLEFEQFKFLILVVFLEQSHFVWKTCARRNLPVACRTLILFSSSLNDLSELRQVSRPCLVSEYTQQAKRVATCCGKVACRRGPWPAGRSESSTQRSRQGPLSGKLPGSVG